MKDTGTQARWGVGPSLASPWCPLYRLFLHLGPQPSPAPHLQLLVTVRPPGPWRRRAHMAWLLTLAPSPVARCVEPGLGLPRGTGQETLAMVCWWLKEAGFAKGKVLRAL